ncbi:rtcB, partial [Symbiodinium pilosum]
MVGGGKVVDHSEGTSAKAGQLGIIPGTGTGSYIVRGEGEADSWQCLAHMGLAIYVQ